MKTRTIAAVLAFCLASVIAMAVTQTVVLRNGDRVTGEVTKTPEGYRVETKMGTKTYRNDEVSSVEADTSVADQYQDMLKKVNPKTADDHYTLAEWAYRNGMLDVAQKHLASALELDPEHTKALALRKQVQAKLAQTPTRTPPGETGTPGPNATSKPAKVGEENGGIKPEYLLSEDDIYHVRLAELRPGEKVSVKFRKDLINTYIKDRTGKKGFETVAQIDRFKGLAPFDQMGLILKTPVLNDDELDGYRDGIQITSDPKFMQEFQHVVWPMVSASCALSQCHGGNEAPGGFKLFTGASRTAQIDYTNFVILDGFVGKQGRMVSRGDPTQSLLLNYLLPPDLAKMRHPKKITTQILDIKDPRYLAITAWIGNLKSDHPAYRLKYQAPFGMHLVEKDLGEVNTTPSSAPASAPAATDAPAASAAPAPAAPGPVPGVPPVTVPKE